MITTNRERLGRMFDTVAPVLDAFIESKVQSKLPDGEDWTYIIRQVDQSKAGSQSAEVNRADPHAMLRMLAKNTPNLFEKGWYPFRLNESQRGWANELFQARHVYAHFKPTPGTMTARALETASLLMESLNAAAQAHLLQGMHADLTNLLQQIRNVPVQSSLTAEVTMVTADHIEMKLPTEVPALLKKADITRKGRAELTELLHVGDQVLVTAKEIDDQVPQLVVSYAPYRHYKAGFKLGDPVTGIVVNEGRDLTLVALPFGATGTLPRTNRAESQLKKGQSVAGTISSFNDEHQSVGLAIDHRSDPTAASPTPIRPASPIPEPTPPLPPKRTVREFRDGCTVYDLHDGQFLIVHSDGREAPVNAADYRQDARPLAWLRVDAAN